MEGWTPDGQVWRPRPGRLRTPGICVCQPGNPGTCHRSLDTDPVVEISCKLSEDKLYAGLGGSSGNICYYGSMKMVTCDMVKTSPYLVLLLHSVLEFLGHAFCPSIFGMLHLFN